MVNCYIQIQHDLISQFNHISCFYHNILYFSMRTLTTRIASITTFFISAYVLWQRELLLSQHSLFQHAYFDNVNCFYHNILYFSMRTLTTWLSTMISLWLNLSVELWSLTLLGLLTLPRLPQKHSTVTVDAPFLDGETAMVRMLLYAVALYSYGYNETTNI